ncbi:LytR/AlgR family response regulator transcription factor [Paludibaculum fermentans]|uniref:LytR/AlgR family response regulator transcription factor n=1 Tax=Paludibaculum fermentans TaxID=1473598 RepID=UPI003EBD4FE8
MTAAPRIRALLVDDEPLARKNLRLLLERDQEIEVAGESASGLEAMEDIPKLEPDLVFLDVQMPEADGFDVIATLDPENMPVIVFVTAYDQHAIRAFEVQAVDYVLKPFDDERFAKALENAKRQVRCREMEQLGERLLALAAARPGQVKEGEAAFTDRFIVRTGNRLVLVRAPEIDWIEAADYYVRLHVAGRAHLVRQSMAEMERCMDPEKFVRVHRSTIVNIDRIREVQLGVDGEHRAVLSDGTELKISRGYRRRLGFL